MATIFSPPYFTALDAAGDPIVNASLTFYATGTDTLATVYSDGAGLFPLATSVLVTDSAGRAPSIFLGDDTYRLIVRNGAGVVIRDLDPISGQKTGLAGFISSVDYATGDGITDDTAGIVAANLAAATLGKPLYLTGHHRITSLVTFTTPVNLAGGTLTGSGSVAFTKNVDGDEYYAFDVQVTDLGTTAIVKPAWFGGRQDKTVATGIETKSWNNWPAFITGANFQASPGHNFGNAAYLAANRPFLAGTDTWDQIALQRAVFAIGLKSGTIRLNPGYYYINRPVRFTCNGVANMRGAGALSSYITSNNWATHSDKSYTPLLPGVNSGVNTRVLLQLYQNGPTALIFSDFCCLGQSGYAPLRSGGTSPLACISMEHCNAFTPERMWFTSCEVGIVSSSGCSDTRMYHCMFEFCSYGVWGDAGSNIKVDICSFWQSWAFASNAVWYPNSTVWITGAQVVGMDEPFNVGISSKVDADVYSATGGITTTVSTSRVDRSVAIGVAGAVVLGRVKVPLLSGMRVRVVVGGISQGSGGYGSEAIYNIYRDTGTITAAQVANTEWGSAPAQTAVSTSITAGSDEVDLILTTASSTGFQGQSTIYAEGAGYCFRLQP